MNSTALSGASELSFADCTTDKRHPGKFCERVRIGGVPRKHLGRVLSGIRSRVGYCDGWPRLAHPIPQIGCSLKQPVPGCARRVWRYFRALGRNAPEAWLAAVGAALIQYTDDDLADGDQVVDNRSLMHIAFFHCSAMTFGPRHVDIAEGVSVFDLPPAPWQPKLWKSEPGYDTLLNIATTAGSRFVSLWAIELLERDHAERLRSLDASTLITLLRNDHSVIREFAVETLESQTAFDLFSSDQLICLATHADPTVSAIGFRELRARHAQAPVDGESLRSLAASACPEIGAEITPWALQQLTAIAELEASAQLSVDHLHLVAFFESRNRGVRMAAFAWLDAVCSESSSENRLVGSDFWNRLTESAVAGVARAAVRILRSHWTKRKIVKFADLPGNIVSKEMCGTRNRAWAISQLAGLGVDNPIRSNDNVLSVVAAALRSSRSELRQAALVAAARLKIDPGELKQRVSLDADDSGSAVV